MVSTYERSGSGAGQRDEDDEDYGRVDIAKCVEGDDRARFMESGVKEKYLLYWWHKLDVEGFVQFTLCILDKFQRANTSNFQLVSNVYNENSSKKKRKRKRIRSLPIMWE